MQQSLWTKRVLQSFLRVFMAKRPIAFTSDKGIAVPHDLGNTLIAFKLPSGERKLCSGLIQMDTSMRDNRPRLA